MNKKYIAVIILLIVNFITNADYPKSREERRSEEIGSLLGEGGIRFNIGSKKAAERHNNVNNFLWFAALDVLEMFSLNSTDFSGGIIITDWYNSTEEPGSRFKITVMISGETLAPESVDVVVHKKYKKNNHWVSELAPKYIANNIEEKILLAARELALKYSK